MRNVCADAQTSAEDLGLVSTERRKVWNRVSLRLCVVSDISAKEGRTKNKQKNTILLVSSEWKELFSDEA